MFGLGTPELLLIIIVIVLPAFLIYRLAFYKGKSEGLSNNNSQNNSIYCSKCGSKNNIGDSYCSKCGNALK
ncbi:MAG: zinc-ribbon domain-containing protein [Bacteroidetes bacterium]|nr:zinc-ribbon domain-containing protein [Bacteroidota bacterium]